MTGTGFDGAKGLRMMRDAGCATFVQDPATATVGEAPVAALAADAAQHQVGLADVAATLLATCSMT